MIRRIIAAGFMALGVSTVLFLFIIIRNLKFGYLSRYNLSLVIMGIALINIGGIVYLIRKRRDHPRWLIITGISGNGLSLFMIIYSILGCLFLEYVFRM
jgi:uncharacterized membrane protein